MAVADEVIEALGDGDRLGVGVDERLAVTDEVGVGDPVTLALGLTYSAGVLGLGVKASLGAMEALGLMELDVAGRGEILAWMTGDGSILKASDGRAERLGNPKALDVGEGVPDRATVMLAFGVPDEVTFVVTCGIGDTVVLVPLILCISAVPAL